MQRSANTDPQRGITAVCIYYTEATVDYKAGFEQLVIFGQISLLLPSVYSLIYQRHMENGNEERATSVKLNDDSPVE